MANVGWLFPVKSAETCNAEVAEYVTSAVDMPVSDVSVPTKGEGGSSKPLELPSPLLATPLPYWSNRLEKLKHPTRLPEDQVDHVKILWEIDGL